MKRKLLFFASFLMCFGLYSMAESAYENLTITDNVCQISSAKDLVNFAKAVNDEGYYTLNAVLTADIDMQDASSDFLPIGNETYSYSAVFDGQGYKISNLLVDLQQDRVGLFGLIQAPCTIKNFFLDETCTISGANYVAIIGQSKTGVKGDIFMTNLGMEGTVKASGKNAGGIIGNNMGSAATFHFKNCYVTGPILAATGSGIITGYAGTNPTFVSCWSSCEMTGYTNLETSFARGADGSPKFENCFSSFGTQVPTLTLDMLTSGELAYKLNGDQSQISWYQTLVADQKPTLDPTHKTVYAIGERRCDGSFIGEATYSNEKPEIIIPQHEYSEGFCSICGSLDPDFLPMKDEFYQIGNGTDVLKFMAAVNAGNPLLNAQLTADIDMSGSCETFIPIGTEDVPYQGKFDGQGHKISNFVISLEQNCVGLFGIVQSPADISNLILDESCSIECIGNYCALIGQSKKNATGDIYMTNLGMEGTIHLTGYNGAGIIGNNMGNTSTFHIKNCYVSGNVTADGAYSGAITAYAANNGTFENCWVTGQVTGTDGEDKYFIRGFSSGTIINCYCKYGTQVTKIEDSQVESGELCYLLNQNGMYWYQTLGEDIHPVLDSAHGVVYVSAELSCNGQILGEASFTNDKSQASTVPDHEYENGVCKNCGQKQEGFMEPDEEGFYNISDASQLAWFAASVNGGTNDLKARLTDDIDMADYSNAFQPIGNETSSYCGIFDGQSHRISNLVISLNQDRVGLFGLIQAPCTIKNLILDESCSISGANYCGIIGQSKTGVKGDIFMTNLGMEGSVNASGKNAGGIIGNNMGSAATFHFENCYVTGPVVAATSSGIITGYAGTNPTFVRCWSSCEMTGYTNLQTSFARGADGSPKFENCFSTFGTQVPSITQDEVYSGELCYKLNGSSFVNPTWFQTIGEDDVPVWDSSHGIVYKAGDMFADVHDAASFKEFKGAFLSSEQEYCENVIAEQALIDQYAEKITTMEDFATMEEFAAAYDEFRSMRAPIEASEKAYQTFQSKVTETIAYLEEHGDFEGPLRDQLTDYLTDIAESSELYPYGTAPYIMELHILSAADLQAEMAKIDDILERAIAEGFGTHANITSLLTNADFSNAYNGWSGAAGNGTNSPCAECKNTTCDFYQTLTELKNGVYEICVNGFFRPGNPTNDTGNLTSTNYGAMFYANGIQNYLMAAVEGMISVADAVDGENCYLTNTAGSDFTDYSIYNESDELIGYVPGGQTAFKFAVRANRYLNRVLVNVTDGTLTIGFKCPGTGVANDAMDIANIQLYYHGSLDDASEQLDATLEGMGARAQTLCDYVASEGADYAEYPNYSAELRSALKSAIDAIGSTTSVNDKYALIGQFSDLFQQVYDSKKSYVKLMMQVEKLTDMAAAIAPMLSGEEISGINDTMETLIVAYINGAVTEEMANTDYVSTLSFMPNLQDGIYQLSSGKDLALFSSLVNNGQIDISAVLTADIDMTDFNAAFQPIGTEDASYCGEFDGQFHKISNLHVNAPQSGVGFFGVIKAPCTIKNLVLDSTCTIEGGENYVGMIGKTKQGVAGPVNLINLGNEGNVNLVGFNGGGVLGNNHGATASVKLENCYATGTIVADRSSAALCGYLGSKDVVINCWTSCEITGIDSQEKYQTRGDCSNYQNCYGLNGNQPQFTKIDASQLETGELAFLLNENGTGMAWYQNIGEDTHPVFDPSHKTVFTTAERRCDNVIIGEGTYTNDENLASKAPDHQYENDICTVCGQMNPNFLEMKDGFYQIANAEQLIKFMTAVNLGNSTINAQLTADIDMTGFNEAFLPIGTEDYPYCGSFDGMFHRINNLSISLEQNCVGFFGIIKSPAVIANLILDESCSIECIGNYCALIGQSKKGATGDIYMTNLGMEGTIHLTGYNGAGIIGNNNGNSSVFHMKNCYVSGNVTADGAYSGALTGFAANNGTFENCWVTGQVTGTDSEDKYFIRGFASGTITNCYCKYGTQVTKIEDSQVESGELCYLLNGDQSEITWYQNIGKDMHPVFDASHGVVMQNEDGSFYTEMTSISNIYEQSQSESIYNLMGQKVQKTHKGIYIIGGKKVLVNK